MGRPAIVYQPKVTLRGSEPPIWRRFLVRADATLARLHLDLQRIMGWADAHLHQFNARGTYFGTPDPELPGPREHERKVRLDHVLVKPGDRFVYEYDFGDGWRHDIVLERVIEFERGMRFPCVIDGKRACPPEDCGGIRGYARLLRVLADPGHPEHRDLVEWVGGSFDPEAFDVGEINRSFHGGWYLPKDPGVPRSPTALPRRPALRPAARSAAGSRSHAGKGAASRRKGTRATSGGRRGP